MIKPFCIIIVLILISNFSQAAYAKTQKSLPVIILNDANKFPYTTINNDGFLNLLLIEAFRRIGFKLETVRLPAERGLLSANDGIVDGEVNRIAGIEKNYTNLRRVPEKIRESDFCVLSTDANIVNTPGTLKKHIVGYVKGWKIYERMMAGSDNVITANNPLQLFRLLKINRIEVALYTCLQGGVLVKEFGIKGVSVLEPRLKQREMFLYLNKKHEKLLPALGKALRDIKQEGLYDALYKEKILPYMLPYKELIK